MVIGGSSELHSRQAGSSLAGPSKSVAQSAYSYQEAFDDVFEPTKVYPRVEKDINGFMNRPYLKNAIEYGHKIEMTTEYTA